LFFGAGNSLNIIKKTAILHNDKLAFILPKTPLVVAFFPCQPNLLYFSKFPLPPEWMTEIPLLWRPLTVLLPDGFD